jgi:hypothetical protein
MDRQAAVERLGQSKVRRQKANEQDGREAGRRWASAKAEHHELKRLADEESPGDILGDLDSVTDDRDLLDLISDDDFAHGFVEAAVDFWREVEPDVEVWQDVESEL